MQKNDIQWNQAGYRKDLYDLQRPYFPIHSTGETVSADVIISVRKLYESESGQMVFQKVQSQDIYAVETK